MRPATISHSRYLFQRYSVSALYLILTGVIIVPAVLLAMRASFEPNLDPTRTRSDTPATNAANSLPISTTTTPSSAIADNPAVVTKLPASSAAAAGCPFGFAADRVDGAVFPGKPHG